MSEKQKSKLTHKRLAVIVVFLIVFFVIVVGSLIEYFVFGHSWGELVEEALLSVLGTAFALGMIDIVLEILTKDTYAEEVSHEITETLMARSEVLDSFSAEQRKNFLGATIRSLFHDEDAVDMVDGTVRQLSATADELRLRTSFNYTITQTHEVPEHCKELFLEEQYFFIKEVLKYEIKFVGSEKTSLTSQEVKIGFPFDKKTLDDGLLDYDDGAFSSCIFNENLDIEKDDFEKLKKYCTDNAKYEQIFNVVLKIDGVQGELKNFTFEQNGIIATYQVDYDISRSEHAVCLIFQMPRLWNSIFEVTLVDPTKNPNITFYYDSHADVEMYSYLNKEKSANNEALEERNGLYDITIENEWIYPKSGVVFHIRKKPVSHE